MTDAVLTPRAPRLLIMGGGAVVAEYYVPALKTLGYIDKTTIIDVSADVLRILKERYPGIIVQQADFRKFLDELAGQDKFDAAIIALPNWHHEEAAMKALQCGLHVLCEKPLVLSNAACIRLANKADSVNRILAVGMVRRLTPSAAALREALKSDLIGPIQGIDIEYGESYAWPSESGAFFKCENGGILADMGVHYLDLVEELIGHLNPVSYCDDYNGGVEANCEFNLRSDSNIPVRLRLSRKYKLRNTAVFKGRDGELILEKDTFESCLLHLYRANGLRARLYHEKPFLGGNWPFTFESSFTEQFFRFAAYIQGFPVKYVNARDATSTINLIEWAYSNRTAAKPVYFILDKLPERPKFSPGPVAVTGGTGFIGAHLVGRLHELGFNKITVPVRNYYTCASVGRFPVDMPRTNLLDYRQVKTIVKGARYVFHLAYGRDGLEADRSRVTIEGAKNVVSAAIETGAESVVILSTMYVFGRPNTKDEVDESWPYAPVGGEYGRSKAKMEKWCLERAKASRHTRIIILNPSCVYGPDGKTYTQLPVQMARDGIFCWIEDGRGIANYTFVENLIDAMLLAASCPRAHAERFIINDGATSWRLFLEPLLGSLADRVPSYTKEQLLSLHRQQPRPRLVDAAKAIAADPRITDILKQTSPGHLMMQLAQRHGPGLLRKARCLRRSLSSGTPGTRAVLSIPPIWLTDLFSADSTVFSAKKARAILNWQPRIDLKNGQETTAAWLRYIGLP